MEVTPTDFCPVPQPVVYVMESVDNMPICAELCDTLFPACAFARLRPQERNLCLALICAAQQPALAAGHNAAPFVSVNLASYNLNVSADVPALDTPLISYVSFLDTFRLLEHHILH